MEIILRELEKQLMQKQDTIFVVVTEAGEGTPGKTGACMLVGSEGRLQGTIGGGNLEYQAIGTAQKLLKDGGYLYKEYVLTPESEKSPEFVCGGNAKVLFHCLKADSQETENLVKKGLSVCRTRTPFWMAVPLEKGEMAVWERKEYHKYRESSETGAEEYYIERFFQEGKVYIFGGGHVANELVPILARVGFRCVVADDRKEYANPERFPEAEEVLLVNYEHLEPYFQVEKEDYMILMTRGHQWDAACERFALGTEAFYIGVMGSSRKAKYIRDLLREEGFLEEQLDRVTTPVGLDIGSETPQEIAVSIAAQLIQVRAETRKETETDK